MEEDAVTASEALKEKMAAFKEAVYGLPCAGCGVVPQWFTGYSHHSHHVVLQQHLQVEDQWDVRGALPVCDERYNNCHGRHHGAYKRLSQDVLTGDNLEFIHEVRGEEAPYYIARHYAQEEADAA